MMQKIIFTVITAALLTGCVDDKPQAETQPNQVVVQENGAIPLLELEATGSERGWRMTWDGNTMTIIYDEGVNSIVRNPVFIAATDKKAWNFQEGETFKVSVEVEHCVDKAGISHLYQVNIQLKNGLLFTGCGDPKYGQPGQPAIPETITDPNWTNRYSPEIPYYNRTNTPIPITMGASPRTAFVGHLEPGEGGYIQTCAENSSYCQLQLFNNRLTGYVNMDLLEGSTY